jgi:hypothetical protein
MHGHTNIKTHTSTNILSDTSYRKHNSLSPQYPPNTISLHPDISNADTSVNGHERLKIWLLLPVVRNRPWPFSCTLADQPEVLGVFWFLVPGTIECVLIPGTWHHWVGSGSWYLAQIGVFWFLVPGTIRCVLVPATWHHHVHLCVCDAVQFTS